MPEGELGAGDALPPGPYSVGMYEGPRGETAPPWVVRCGDGRAIAGHVPSRQIAEKIAEAMNWADLTKAKETKDARHRKP